MEVWCSGDSRDKEVQAQPMRRGGAMPWGRRCNATMLEGECWRSHGRGANAWDGSSDDRGASSFEETLLSGHTWFRGGNTSLSSCNTSRKHFSNFPEGSVHTCGKVCPHLGATVHSWWCHGERGAVVSVVPWDAWCHGERGAMGCVVPW